MKYISLSLLLHLSIFFLFFYRDNQNIIIEKKISKSIEVNLSSLKKEFPLEEDPSEMPKLTEMISKQEIKLEKSSIKKNETTLKKKISKPLEIKKEIEISTEKSITHSSLSNEKVSDFPTENSSLEDFSIISESSSDFIFQGENKIGKNQNISGVYYSILKETPPKYPIQAKKIGYKKQVIIKTKFLVNHEGKIEDIEILEGLDQFGFREEVLKALKTFKFTPIFYKDEKIKLYFYKDFVFQLNG